MGRSRATLGLNGVRAMLTLIRKACSVCFRLLPTNHFPRNQRGIFGLHPQCSECRGLLYRGGDPELAAARRSSREETRRTNERLRKRRFRRERPDVARAHQILTYAITSGQIQRPDNCSKCGCGCVPDGHHWDYSKPLEVEWLCHKCHAEISFSRRYDRIV